jgi:hypothetical protein
MLVTYQLPFLTAEHHAPTLSPTAYGDDRRVIQALRFS